jgi:hypothetical protein
MTLRLNRRGIPHFANSVRNDVVLFFCYGEDPKTTQDSPFAKGAQIGHPSGETQHYSQEVSRRKWGVGGGGGGGRGGRFGRG